MKPTKLLLLLAFILCFTISCSAKDSYTYLLTSIEDSNNDTTKFEYDSLNRMVSMESNSLKRYLFYNQEGKPDRAVIKIITQSVSMTDSSIREHEIVVTSKYRYIGSDTIIIRKHEVENPLFDTESPLSAIRPIPIYYTCILNDKGMASKIVRENNWETISFEYDENDNLTKLTILAEPSTKTEKSFQSETTYKYDNKKNPYSFLPPHVAYNLAFPDVIGKNNIQTMKTKDFQTKDDRTTDISYKYNKEGYPTEMKIEKSEYWQKFNYQKQ